MKPDVPPPVAPTEPFRARATRPAGVLQIGDWRLKAYGIAHRGPPDELDAFEDVHPILFDALPDPARAPGRPGVGVVILHRGRGQDYAVLGWWDRDNELPLRVWVREEDQGEWRAAEGPESVCVWDLHVISHERNSFVTRVLARAEAPDITGYLGDTITVSAPNDRATPATGAGPRTRPGSR